MAQAQRVLVHLLPNSPSLFAEACHQLFESLFFPPPRNFLFFPPLAFQDPNNPHFTFSILISLQKAVERSLGAPSAINTTSHLAGMASTVQWGRWGGRSSSFWDSVWHSQSPSQTPFLCGAREWDSTSHAFLLPVVVNSRLQITPGKRPVEDPSGHKLPGGGLSQTPTALVLVIRSTATAVSKEVGNYGKDNAAGGHNNLFCGC